MALHFLHLPFPPNFQFLQGSDTSCFSEHLGQHLIQEVGPEDVCKMLIRKVYGPKGLCMHPPTSESALHTSGLCSARLHLGFLGGCHSRLMRLGCQVYFTGDKALGLSEWYVRKPTLSSKLTFLAGAFSIRAGVDVK